MKAVEVVDSNNHEDVFYLNIIRQKVVNWNTVELQRSIVAIHGKEHLQDFVPSNLGLNLELRRWGEVDHTDYVLNREAQFVTIDNCLNDLVLVISINRRSGLDELVCGRLVKCGFLQLLCHLWRTVLNNLLVTLTDGNLRRKVSTAHLL